METEPIWKFWVNTNQRDYRDFSVTGYPQLPLTCHMTDEARDERRNRQPGLRVDVPRPLPGQQQLQPARVTGAAQTAGEPGWRPCAPDFTLLFSNTAKQCKAAAGVGGPDRHGWGCCASCQGADSSRDRHFVSHSEMAPENSKRLETQTHQFLILTTRLCGFQVKRLTWPR